MRDNDREKSSFNKVELLGRLGRDPEIRSTFGGGSVCNLSVATTESWKDKQTGDWVNKSEWHRISTFAPEHIATMQRCNKGDKVYLTGQIATREWTDKNGEKRSAVEIKMMPWHQFELRDRAPAGRDGSESRRRDVGQHDYRERPLLQEVQPLDDILNDDLSDIPWD